MKRFALSLVVAVMMLDDQAIGQTFSSDADYGAFYKSRFNPNYQASAEPTIALWWIIENCGDVDVPWETLRDCLLRHKELFPDSEHADRVKSHLKVVARMVDEKRPPAERKIERLIFDLRELNIRQCCQPNNGLRILRDDSLRIQEILGGTPPPLNAAQQLRDTGYDAIPMLIEHIDDDTLTRSVDFWRDHTFSHEVLTVGECCRQIIDAILPTGRRFDVSSDPKAAKEAMKNWYVQLIEEKKSER